MIRHKFPLLRKPLSIHFWQICQNIQSSQVFTLCQFLMVDPVHQGNNTQLLCNFNILVWKTKKNGKTGSREFCESLRLYNLLIHKQVDRGQGGQCCGGSQRSINTMKAYKNELIPRQYFFDTNYFQLLLGLRSFQKSGFLKSIFFIFQCI